MLLVFILAMRVSKGKIQQNTLGISTQKLQPLLNQSSTGFIFQPFSVLLYFVDYGLSLLVLLRSNIQKNVENNVPEKNNNFFLKVF